MKQLSPPLSSVEIYRLTSEICKPGSPLYKNSREAIDDFEDMKYESCLLKIGIASEALTDIFYSLIIKNEKFQVHGRES
jgi:hypothetical protein